LAISPPSDLIVDVARAADPSALLAAKDRLARMSASAQASTAAKTPEGAQRAAAGRGSANTTFASWEAHAKQAQPASPGSGIVSAAQAGMPGQAKGKLDPYKQFEAFVMQSFIQTMLPSDAADVYGTGTAGQVWRSMLAEHMANEIARSGNVGIADSIRAAAAAKTAATDATAKPEKASPQALQGFAPIDSKSTAPDRFPAHDPSGIWPAATVKHT
jgi:flagellar protein FlgJ